jgi:hypothetical protein
MLCGCHHNAGDATLKFMLLATPNDAEEFRSLFATEPSCHGLTLGESAVIRLHYYGAVDAARTEFGGYIVHPNTNPDVNFSGDTPEKAISHACAILKAQGGKIE